MKPINAAGNSRFVAFFMIMVSLAMPNQVYSQRTQKPVLYGRHWVAVTGKPIAATAGAILFQKGGNGGGAAGAAIGGTPTTSGTLSWGGETQAPFYHPPNRRALCINALAVPP